MGYKKSVFQSLAMVTQLGLCVVTPVLFCVFAGNYIDSMQEFSFSIVSPGMERRHWYFF